MATINDIADLVRILDEKPEWLAEIRTRVLSRELLDLPEEFARFVAEVRQFIAATDQRLAALEAGQQQMQDDIGTLQDDVGTLKSDVGTLKNQMADVRGRIVYDIAHDEAPFLADDMGFNYVATLSRNDLQKLIESVDTSAITRQNLQSFRRADLVIQAVDPDGTAIYIAVEVSYTVDGNDIRRARRNAEYLTRLTGVPAVAAVAGVIIDPRVQDVIDAGELYWYEIPMGDLQPE